MKIPAASPKFQGLHIKSSLLPGDYDFLMDREANDEVTLTVAYPGDRDMREERTLKWRSQAVRIFQAPRESLGSVPNIHWFKRFTVEDVRPVLISAIQESSLPEPVKEFFLTRLQGDSLRFTSDYGPDKVMPVADIYSPSLMCGSSFEQVAQQVAGSPNDKDGAVALINRLGREIHPAERELYALAEEAETSGK